MHGADHRKDEHASDEHGKNVNSGRSVRIRPPVFTERSIFTRGKYGVIAIDVSRTISQIVCSTKVALFGVGPYGQPVIGPAECKLSD